MLSETPGLLSCRVVVGLYVRVRSYVYRAVLQSKEERYVCVQDGNCRVRKAGERGPSTKALGGPQTMMGWSPVVLVLQDPIASEMRKFYIVLHRVRRGRNPWSPLRL